MPRFRPLASAPGPAVLGLISGVCLVVSVFLPWYTANLTDPASPVSRSGWDTTSVAKGVVALGVIVALASALLLADYYDKYRIDSRTMESLGWLVAGGSLVAAGLVAFRLFKPPEPADFLTRDFGLFTALVAAAVGLAAGIAQATQR